MMFAHYQGVLELREMKKRMVLMTWKMSLIITKEISKQGANGVGKRPISLHLLDMNLKQFPVLLMDSR